jgi:tetratricopeptide (TPR) repeat protein
MQATVDARQGGPALPQLAEQSYCGVLVPSQPGRPSDSDGGPERGASAVDGRTRRRAESKPVFNVHGVRSPLVGRDDTLAVLQEALTRAVDFQAPQLVTIVGNQGTGKSRVVAELIERAVHAPVRVFHGRARDRSQRWGAIASMLRDRFELVETDSPELSQAKFAAGVKAAFSDEQIAEVLHFLGGFVDLAFPSSPFLRVLNENPEQHAEIARTVLRRFIEADAHSSPLLLVFDDLQWADDDTLRLLRELGAGLGGSPVMMIACTRPEMLVRCATWGAGVTDHERLDLRNLEPDDAERMFRNLMSRCDGVSDDIVDDAVEMTGGNPHFLEQLVRLFLANGTIDASGPRWRLDPTRAAETELPISIEEAIEARVAALGKGERELLEKGAVLGSVFWMSAVVALGRIGAASAGELGPRPPLGYRWTPETDSVRRDVAQVIDALCDADYLLRLDPEDSTIPGDIELVFKHNLERELIVQSTEPDKLARYHLLAAEWLESKLAGRSEEQLEFLAQLYERGGDRRRAARCYLAGGDKARLRYASDEAVSFYRRGLAMLGDDEATARIDALHNLGDVLDMLGRVDESIAAFGDMLHLAWLLDNQAKAGAAHSRLARIQRRQGQYDRAMEHLRESSELFTRAVDDRGVAGVLDDIGRVHWLRGAYGQALDYHRQALSVRRALGDRRSIALSLANIGRVHRDSGAFKAAIAQFREALDLRRDIGDLAGVVQSLCDLGGVNTADGQHELALELFGEARKLANDIGDRFAMADVLSRLGECKSAMGRGWEAIAHLTEAAELARGLGDRVVLSECRRRLAEVRLSLGEVEEAEEDAREALSISEAVGSRVHIGAAHRALAEVYAAADSQAPSGGRTRAEEHFRKAIDILAAMKNELELARCYRAFAQLRERVGQRDEAQKLRSRADEIYQRLRGAATID